MILYPTVGKKRGSEVFAPVYKTTRCQMPDYSNILLVNTVGTSNSIRYIYTVSIYVCSSKIRCGNFGCVLHTLIKIFRHFTTIDKLFYPWGILQPQCDTLHIFFSL